MKINELLENTETQFNTWAKNALGKAVDDSATLSTIKNVGKGVIGAVSNLDKGYQSGFQKAQDMMRGINRPSAPGQVDFSDIANKANNMNPEEAKAALNRIAHARARGVPISSTIDSTTIPILKQKVGIPN